MNIFVLDLDPRTSAMMMCDSHVVKMTLESTQMIATMLRLMGYDDDDLLAMGLVTKAGTPYKSTHQNHPCVRWLMECGANRFWFVQHAVWLAREYSVRYHKHHACHQPIDDAVAFMLKHKLFGNPKDKSDMTPFAQAMPDQYKQEDAVEAYRDYYNNEKAGFAKWTVRSPPVWFNVMEALA
jgi:hypothetical protein